MKKLKLSHKAASASGLEKEKIQLQNPRNAYYDNVSGVYHALFLITVVLLLVFTCVAMLTNLDLFTYENFYYLAKDISAASNLLAGSGNVIHYETSVRNQDFAIYRGGLAVGGDMGLQLFTATGRETMNATTNYSQPVLQGSDRYLLMYDIGEKSYSIYNSFVCVHHEECEYPVFVGTMSDSGYYAVVSESYDHAGVVSLYNDRFELINRYNRTQMVTSVAINQAGNRIAFATAEMKDGEYLTTLVIAVPGQNTTSAEMPFEGLFPYSLTFIDQHRLLLIGDRAAYIISVDDGAVICPIMYTGMQLAYADANDQLITLVFCVNPVTDSYRMIVTDRDGNLITDQIFDAGVSQVTVFDQYVYLLTEQGISRIQPSNLAYQTIDCNTGGKKILICKSDEVILCGGQSAIYYKFEN